MTRSDNPPKSIEELIDHIEQLREELFAIQRSLEKMEPIQTLVDDAELKKP